MTGFYRKILILLTLYVSYGYIYPPKFLRKKNRDLLDFASRIYYLCSSFGREVS